MPREILGWIPCALAAAAGVARAQLAEGRPGWSGVGELSGNVYFGAARQRLVSTTLGAGHADSALAARGEVVAAYGDAVSADPGAAGVWRVTVRNARLTLNVDRRPYARVSAFVLGTVESSLQQGIAQRSSAGLGAKYTLWRPRAPVPGFPQDASLSVALLTERTRAIDPGAMGGGVGARTRWSLRARLRRRLPAGVRLTQVTYYQPTVDQAARRYTVESTTALALPLGARAEATATLRDRFDSEARLRGARSDHDGQLLFGVRLAF